jgi:hypothetical protein
MKTIDRKAAVAAYKERGQDAGVYAFTCVPTGAVWVGSSANLAQIGNRITFDLGLGKHRNAALQAAWNAHGGEKSFRFEVREVIDADTPDYLRSGVLKDRLEHWRKTLGAAIL